MKRRTLSAVLFLAVSALCIYAAARGGGAEDPLVSLSYLNGTFTETVNSRIAAPAGREFAPGSQADVWTETRVKRGDVLTGSTGTNVLVLAGGVAVTFPFGAVVDVTAGTEVASGAALTVNHRYMVAEDTSASFTVTSKTAVLNYQGPYAFAFSAQPDYNAMAEALKTMHLFRGSFTGYGSGFDLEVSPTRLQALIMFVRILGEEDAALAYAGSCPFTDIAKGSEPERYVAYAYSKGYTNGYTASTFAPAQKVNAYQYTEFVLRALGYSTAANTDLSGTLSRAVECGVLTAGEKAALEKDAFLRADLAYISYYALDAALAQGGQTLRQTLLIKGVFTDAESGSAAALVTGQRIS